MQTDPNWSNFFYDPQLHKVSPSSCCSACTRAGFHQLLIIPHSQSVKSPYGDSLIPVLELWADRTVKPVPLLLVLTCSRWESRASVALAARLWP